MDRRARNLCLAHTQVTDAGLSRLRGLNQLLWLDLSFTEAGDAGLASFAESQQLNQLSLEKTRITPADERGEYMMTGLRLTDEGVSEREFESRFGSGLRDTYGRQIESLMGQGLLEWEDHRLRLTRRGRLLGNRVFVEFIE